MMRESLEYEYSEYEDHASVNSESDSEFEEEGELQKKRLSAASPRTKPSTDIQAGPLGSQPQDKPFSSQPISSQQVEKYGC